MTRTIRLSTTLALLALAVLIVAACGGATSPSPSAVSTPEPTPSATPTDEPTDSAGPTDDDDTDLTGAAAALDALDGYQVDLSVSGIVPAASGASGVTMTAILDRANDAVDFTMSGFEGLGTGDDSFRVILIGDDAWIDLGTGTFLAQPGGAAAFEGMVESLSPTALLGSIPDDGFGDLQPVGDEDKNGVATTHYRLDSTVPGFADSLGEDGEADIWIAADGGYLVSMVMSGVTDVDGVSTAIEMSFDVSRINDPSIDVQPPD